MRRLLRWLSGLFVPKPPPHKDLTPSHEFEREEQDLKYLNEELAAIRAHKPR